MSPRNSPDSVKCSLVSVIRQAFPAAWVSPHSAHTKLSIGLNLVFLPLPAEFLSDGVERLAHRLGDLHRRTGERGDRLAVFVLPVDRVDQQVTDHRRAGRDP